MGKKTAPAARFIKIGEVSMRTSLSPTEINRRVDAGTFPKPVQLGVNRKAWLESVIDDWIEKQVAQASGNKTTTKAREG